MNVLHSIILGEGPAFLILHGFLGMSDNWKTLGNHYAAQGFQVHLVDQRNHGRSFHSVEFDYDLLAEDLKTYIAYHQLQTVILLGHSMGGKTAMQFACTYPGKVQKLLVADIAPKFYPPHHQGIIDGLLALNFETITSRKEADEQLEKHIKEIGIRQFLLKNLYRTDKQRFGLRINLPVLADKMGEVGENIAATASYAGPTLFLRGDRSEYIMERDFATIQRHFPMATMESIDNAGHWLHAENPKQFFTKSISFINS